MAFGATDGAALATSPAAPTAPTASAPPADVARGALDALADVTRVVLAMIESQSYADEWSSVTSPPPDKSAGHTSTPSHGMYETALPIALATGAAQGAGLKRAALRAP